MTSLRKALRNAHSGWMVEYLVGARSNVVRIGPCENPQGYAESINHKFDLRYEFRVTLFTLEKAAKGVGVRLRKVGEQDLDGLVVQFYEVI